MKNLIFAALMLLLSAVSYAGNVGYIIVDYNKSTDKILLREFQKFDASSKKEAYSEFRIPAIYKQTSSGDYFRFQENFRAAYSEALKWTGKGGIVKVYKTKNFYDLKIKIKGIIVENLRPVNLAKLFIKDTFLDRAFIEVGGSQIVVDSSRAHYYESGHRIENSKRLSKQSVLICSFVLERHILRNYGSEGLKTLSREHDCTNILGKYLNEMLLQCDLPQHDRRLFLNMKEQIQNGKSSVFMKWEELLELYFEPINN